MFEAASQRMIDPNLCHTVTLKNGTVATFIADRIAAVGKGARTGKGMILVKGEKRFRYVRDDAAELTDRVFPTTRMKMERRDASDAFSEARLNAQIAASVPAVSA